jgi:hypothetical protein
VPAVLEHVDSLLEGGLSKVVLFAHHHAVIQKLAAHYGEAAVVLYGETSMADRDLAVRRFQEDASVKVFVGGFLAAGVGLTLTAASTVVFAELDWVPGNVTQAEDRTYRIGQKSNVLVQHLIVDGSLDARMIQMVIDKQSIADAALDLSTEVAVPKSASKADRAPGLPELPKYPDYDTETKNLAKAAVTAVAQGCDGAQSLDGAGFSKMDASFGQKLATMRGEFSNGQCHAALKLARRYRRQVPSELCEALKLYEKAEKKPKKTKASEARS